MRGCEKLERSSDEVCINDDHGLTMTLIRPKEKICVFPVTSKKIRVGRSLLIFFIIIFYFP